MQAQSWLDNLSTRYRFRGGIPNTAVFNTFSSGLNRIMRKYLCQHNSVTHINHIKVGFFLLRRNGKRRKSQHCSSSSIKIVNVLYRTGEGSVYSFGEDSKVVA